MIIDTAKIAELTDCNAHTEAIHQAARDLGMVDLVERFEDLNNRHILIGHLSPDLRVSRDLLRAEMIGAASVLLSAEDFAELKTLV